MFNTPARPTIRLSILTAFAVLPLLFAVGCDELGSDEPIENRDDTFQVSGAITLDVDVFNGGITVTGSDTRSVRVQSVLKRADRIDYEAIQTGSGINVSANRKGSTTGRSPSVSVEITAPSSSVLVLRTSNGAIEVRGIETGGTLRTSNGRVTVVGGNGNLRADTSNGTIDVSDFTGSVELETSNGAVRFAGELVAGSENEMTSSNGSVNVNLDDDPSVKLDASTSNGSVSSDFPIVVTSSGRNHLEGTIGDGDADLNVRTSNGSITVR